MKKSKRTSRTKKTKPVSPATVDEYFARVPEPARAMLMQMRAALRSAVPREAVEVISYRIPAFKHERILVWYAAFSDHCSLFPTAAVIAAFKDELKGFKTSKGTIHFPLSRPLPTDLIRKIVMLRVRENQSASS